jgi:hemoglobin
MESLYDRYGGQPFWQRVLDVFYAKNLESPALQGFFTGKNVDRAKFMNQLLLCSALRPSGDHFPVSVKRVHREMAITQSVFSEFAANLHRALTECGVTESDANEILDVIDSFKEDLVKD